MNASFSQRFDQIIDQLSCDWERLQNVMVSQSSATQAYILSGFIWSIATFPAFLVIFGLPEFF